MAEDTGILINRVAESDLQTIALDQLIDINSIVLFDLKDYLFQGMILREKDFRESLKNLDWEKYRGKKVAVYCSADAIIPMWAYMLIATMADAVQAKVEYGDSDQVHEKLLIEFIKAHDWSRLQDKRVVIKGCSDKEIPPAAFLAIAQALKPYVQSMMYGEPCSTVPIFKRPRVV